MSESQEAAFSFSPHLKLGVNADAKNYLYHSLFGNFSWIDQELGSFIQRFRSKKFSWQELLDALSGENVETLYESHFLVNSDQEDRDVIKLELAEREAKLQTGYYLEGLQISSSNACNFGCTYCFADTSENRSDVRREIAKGSQNISFEMAADAVRRMKENVEKNGKRNISVKFLGREPLVNWKVIKKLLETFDDGSVRWAITTNGSLLKDDVCQDLKRHGVTVIVSLDGGKETNDKHRVYKNTNLGTYGAIERGLKALHKAGHPFGVSSVISMATKFDEMRTFVDRIVSLGATELELTLVMQTENPEHINGTSKIVERDRANKALVQNLIDLYKYAYAKGLVVHGDWADPYHRLMTTYKFRDDNNVVRPQGAACSATSHQISIEPSGDLFPCRAMSMHYGTLDCFESVAKSDAYKKVAMRTFYNVPYCQGCALEGFCQGTCLGSSEEATGNIYDPQEEYCQIYRMATQGLLAELSGVQ